MVEGFPLLVFHCSVYVCTDIFVAITFKCLFLSSSAKHIVLFSGLIVYDNLFVMLLMNNGTVKIVA